MEARRVDTGEPISAVSGTKDSLPGFPVQSPALPLKNAKQGRAYVMDTATCSMKLARFMSRSERPAHSWVLRVMCT